MIRAVIFDFDGVILDSADLKTEAFREMFAKYPQHQEQIIAYHRKNMGISRYVKFRHIYEDILKKPYHADDEKKLGDEFESHVYQAVLGAAFIPGADDFLEAHSQSYSCFVASGTPEAELKKVVKARGLETYFKEVHGSPRGKADIVRAILKRHSLLPQEVLFVGDAETDRRAAEETGLHFLGIGIDASQFLKPVQLIRTFETLPAEISRLNECQKARSN